MHHIQRTNMRLFLLLSLLTSALSFVHVRLHNTLWKKGTSCCSSSNGKTKTNPLSATKRPSSSSHIKEKPVNKTSILSAESFVHHEDLRLCQYLAQHPVLNPFTTTVFNSIGNMLVYEHLNNAILVGPDQLPSLYKSLLKGSKVLNIKPPDLYVKHNPVPNANTLAFQGTRPFILLNTGLLDLLDNHEIEAVIGHELGHLKCNHGPWLSLLNLLSIVISSPMGIFLQPLKPLLQRWQCAAEFSCDRASLLVARDFHIVSSTMMKLCGGSAKSRFQKELNVEAFLQQSHRLSEEFSPATPLPLLQGITQQSHPLPFDRLFQLRQWSASKQCSDLLSMTL